MAVIGKAESNPVTRYSPDHKQKTRARVVELAAARIRTHGLQRLTIRLGVLMPDGGRKPALGLLADMASVLAVERTVDDPRQSSEMLATARRTVLVS